MGENRKEAVFWFIYKFLKKRTNLLKKVFNKYQTKATVARPHSPSINVLFLALPQSVF